MGLSENRVYSQWNSHLIGIMISKTIGYNGVHYFQTHPYGKPGLGTSENRKKHLWWFTTSHPWDDQSDRLLQMVTFLRFFRFFFRNVFFFLDLIQIWSKESTKSQVFLADLRVHIKLLRFPSRPINIQPPPESMLQRICTCGYHLGGIFYSRGRDSDMVSMVNNYRC